MSRARSFPRPGSAYAAAMLLACAVAAACGKKGPPLAPVVRIPAAVQGVTASRVGADVYVTLTVPTTNIDRSTPVDIGAVDVYALTAAEAPPRTMFVDRATRIARIPVVQVPAPGATDAPPVQPSTDAVNPAAKVTVLDRGGAVAADGQKRYYLVVPFSTRNRPGPQGAPIEVPLPPLPPPPSGAAATFSATQITVAWSVPTDAVSAPVSPDSTAEAQTRVNVYRDVPAPADQPTWRATRPAPLNTAPLAMPPFVAPVVFGTEVCYVLRTVTGEGTMQVEGAPSARVCTTPIDTFPPAAPTQLVAVAAAGSIGLLWEPNTESDLAGYLVLRGAPGDARLQPLTPAPITETRFVDTTVVPGMRYVYAVVAVDRQMPTPNASAESARVEEAAQ